jgi:hypothetical protein
MVSPFKLVICASDGFHCFIMLLAQGGQYVSHPFSPSDQQCAIVLVITIAPFGLGLLPMLKFQQGFQSANHQQSKFATSLVGLFIL